MNRLRIILIALTLVIVVAGILAGFSYCAFWGDVTSTRYSAICETDD